MSWEQVFLGFVAALLGLASLGALTGAWKKSRLLSRGRWIEAEVVRVREVKGSGDDRLFIPVVAFTPPGGKRVEAESPEGKEYPPGLTDFPDGKVSILYDPIRPERIELRGYEADGILKSLLIGALLAGGAALVLREMVS